MDHTGWGSYITANKKQDSHHVEIDSHKSHSLTSACSQDTADSYFRGLNLEYDEIDLLSECSTPVSYVPGRYLQLCDLSLDIDTDVKLWPISSRTSLTEGNVASLLPGSTRHGIQEGCTYDQTLRKTKCLTQTSSKIVITVAVCAIVALMSLGGLATFV